MAIQYEFTCPDCDYSDFVCGCGGVGMHAVWETMTCLDCRELVDVLVGQLGQRGPSGDKEYVSNAEARIYRSGRIRVLALAVDRYSRRVTMN